MEELFSKPDFIYVVYRTSIVVERMMSTTATFLSKRSPPQRILRSNYGRALIVSILIVLINSFLWWQTIAEHENELRIGRKIMAAGGMAGCLDVQAPALSVVPYSYRINFVRLSNRKLLGEVNALSRLRHLYIDDASFTDLDLVELERLIGLSTLSLGVTKVTDDGINHLKSFANLTDLNFGQTMISDAGLKKLSALKLTNLRSLQLNHTQITDAGLEFLKELPNISSINLANTQVSDSGLEHLKGMTKFREIRLSKTSTTTNGQAELRKSLLNCTIIP